nr:hypothetical protein [Tardiphaga sp.]
MGQLAASGATAQDEVRFFPVSERENIAGAEDFDTEDVAGCVHIVDERASFFGVIVVALADTEIDRIGVGIVCHLGHDGRLALWLSIKAVYQIISFWAGR